MNHHPFTHLPSRSRTPWLPIVALVSAFGFVVASVVLAGVM
ncbi:hypothetical protein [Oceaniradius stylonematis]